MKIQSKNKPAILKVATRALSVVSVLALSFSAWAGGHPPLHVKGYQAAINVLDPSHPGILQVHFEGEGGVANLGKITSQSLDEQVDLNTGILTATTTFTDESGDTLVVAGIGPSVQQPDGRVTFRGEFTVRHGTGRFSQVSGKMRYEGWARVTDLSTLEGIGFFTLEGDLYGVNAKPDAGFLAVEHGTATFDGVNFVYAGAGVGSHLGKFRSHVQTALKPFDGAFNGQFIGIINGRFTLASSFEGVWTHPNGDKLRFSGIEFVSWDQISGGGPDFTKPSSANVYETFDGGTGHFAGTEGVSFDFGRFVPTGPTSISAELVRDGFISLPDK